MNLDKAQRLGPEGEGGGGTPEGQAQLKLPLWREKFS